MAEIPKVSCPFSSCIPEELSGKPGCWGVMTHTPRGPRVGVRQRHMPIPLQNQVLRLRVAAQRTWGFAIKDWVAKPRRAVSNAE